MQPSAGERHRIRPLAAASRYLRLLWVQLRTSSLLALQYRYDFLIEGGISLLYTITALAPLWVIFERREEVVGWSFAEALLVVGWFTLLQGVLEGAINPSLTTVVEHIRKGTLDFVLLKPVDSQFLVSTAKFLPWRIGNVVSAIVIFVYAFERVGWPAPGAVAEAALLFACAIAVLYSLWIIIVSAAFYVVKVDNLTYLFASIFDAARWPIGIFRGFLSLLFTFIIPLALMTTFPAQALLGTLELRTLLSSVAGALAFVVASRWIWLLAIRGYTSASS